MKMRKVLISLLVLVLLTGFVGADTFSTDVQLNLTNSSLVWVVESGTETFGIGNYTRTISINRNCTGTNVSCDYVNVSACNEAIINLSRSARIISEAHQDSLAYYDMYAECWGDLKSCESKSNSSVDWETKLEACLGRACFSQADMNAVENEKNTCEADKKLVEDERDREKQNKVVFSIIALIVGGGGAFLFITKRKTTESTMDREHPTRE